jgi:hypothetical protein
MNKFIFLLTVLSLGVISCLIIQKINYSSKVQSNNVDSVAINKPNKPEDTVLEYYRLSRENKPTQIADIITLFPKSFEDYLINSYSEIAQERLLNKQTKKKKSLDKINDHHEFINREKESKYIAIEIPSNIQTFNQEVVKIDVVKIIGDDARVQIKYLNDRQMGFIDNQYFYLHKEQAQWKIFSVCEFLCVNFPENSPNLFLK